VEVAVEVEAGCCGQEREADSGREPGGVAQFVGKKPIVSGVQPPWNKPASLDLKPGGTLDERDEV
jgi:hypothetical protein